MRKATIFLALVLTLSACDSATQPEPQKSLSEYAQEMYRIVEPSFDRLEAPPSGTEWAVSTDDPRSAMSQLTDAEYAALESITMSMMDAHPHLQNLSHAAFIEEVENAIAGTSIPGQFAQQLPCVWERVGLAASMIGTIAACAGGAFFGCAVGFISYTTAYESAASCMLEEYPERYVKRGPAAAQLTRGGSHESP